MSDAQAATKHAHISPGTFAQTCRGRKCSNTWTMETSHDRKSNTVKSIKNWILLEGLGEQVGFQLRYEFVSAVWRMEKGRSVSLFQPIQWHGGGTLIGERSLACLVSFYFNRGIFSLRVSAVDRKVQDGMEICKRSARYWGEEASGGQWHCHSSHRSRNFAKLIPGIHEIPRILRKFMKSLSETNCFNLLELLVILWIS